LSTEKTLGRNFAQTVAQGLKELSGVAVGDFVPAECVHESLNRCENFFHFQLRYFGGKSAPELAAGKRLCFGLMVARVLRVMTAVGTVAESDAPAAVSGNEDVAAVLHVDLASK